MARSILVVCTGNVCRSPMAACLPRAFGSHAIWLLRGSRRRLAHPRYKLEPVYSQACGRTHKSCESMHTDVPDPYGFSPGIFVIVLELIMQGIASWSTRLGEKASANGQGEAS